MVFLCSPCNYLIFLEANKFPNFIALNISFLVKLVGVFSNSPSAVLIDLRGIFFQSNNF